MTQTAALSRKTLTSRMGTNPKTLHRKALEKAAAAPAPDGEGLEDMFPASQPVAPDDSGIVRDPLPPVAAADAQAEKAELPVADQAAAALTVPIIESAAAPVSATDEPSAPPPLSVAQDQSLPAAPIQQAAPAAWSEADERAYQGLLSRRKAAGFQRRGRDVSAQRVAIGAVTPNPGTVNNAIYELVKCHGPIGRGELLDLMATPAFGHPKAKGGDRAWSQGYVQGAIAAGFLKVEVAINVGERSPYGPVTA